MTTQVARRHVTIWRSEKAVVNAHFRWLLFAAVLAAIIPGSAASAQVVRGRVLDAVRGSPIAGALVELRDSAGTVRARTLSGESGAFALMPTVRDGLSVRIVAIGYTPRPLSPLATFALGDLTMAPHAITLPAIRALADGKGCGGVGDIDTWTRLLDATAGALEVMEATIESGARQFEILEVVTVMVDGRVMQADSSSGVLSEWPIGSISQDSLRAFGFAAEIPPVLGGGRTWYGPDLAVLFAEWFQSSHCFAVSRPDKRTNDIVIRFEPVAKAKLVDLAGEIRLDPVTLAVRELSYTHVNLPSTVGKGAAGGVVRFATDSTGTWVPVYWSIRAPIERAPPRTITRTGGRLPAGIPPTIRVPSGSVERVGRVIGERTGGRR